MKAIHNNDYLRVLDLLISARKVSGVTQNELATLLSKPQSFISKYETAERRLDVGEFIQISKALGIKPSDLLKDVE